MSTGDSFETRFEKIDNLLRDPKSEVNSDCLLVSSAGPFGLSGILYLPSSCLLSHRQKNVQVCIILGSPKNLGVRQKSQAVALFIIGLTVLTTIRTSSSDSVHHYTKDT